MNTLRLAVCSDLHFMAWAETLRPVEWVPGLYHALHDITLQEPDLVIINGDFTNGKTRDYDLAMRAFHQFIHAPIIFTMGNHEYYSYYEESEYSFQLAQNRFRQYTGQKDLYFEKQLGNVTLFFLSPEGLHPDWHDSAWLSGNQLKWLRGRLKQTAGPVLIFLHQPLNDTVAASQNTCFQSDEIKQVLSTYHDEIFVISGHTHRRMDQEDQYVHQRGVHYFGGGCVLKDHPQTRFIELSDGFVHLKLRDHLSMKWITDYEWTIPLSLAKQTQARS